MPMVEFVYDKSCPNIELARENLLRAFARLGLTPKWTEWERNSVESPAHVRDYGSPTILIDGKDTLGIVTGKSSSNSCRVYEGADGKLVGIPSIELLVSALGASSDQNSPGGVTPGKKTRLLSTAAVLPGIGIALLPKLACPACWPAYAGILSSVGLGFLVESRYLMAFTTVFLIVALGALVFRAKTRRGYAPFALGVFAAVLIMGGKFALDISLVMYAGVGLLVAASFWNSWPRVAVRSSSCPSCVQTEPSSNQ